MQLCVLHFALDRYVWDLPPSHQLPGPLWKTLRNLLTKSDGKRKRRLKMGRCIGAFFRNPIKTPHPAGVCTLRLIVYEK